MITKEQVTAGRRIAKELIEKSGLQVTAKEMDGLEVADFGLENYPKEGAQIVSLLDTKKVGYKAICLSEGQILPEHMHTASLGEEGKEETFRVVYGILRLFVPGEQGDVPCPVGKEQYYTCRKELRLGQTDQVTLPPDTPHWLMGGEGGCVVLSISSWARCTLDPFTDPNVIRETVIRE